MTPSPLQTSPHPSNVTRASGPCLPRQITESILLTLLILTLPSCSSPGKLISRQQADQPATVGQAPQDGAYGLFVDGDDHPVFTYHLHQGDKLGFELSDAATVSSIQIKWLYAIFADQRFRLSPLKNYEWRWLYNVRAPGAK